MQKNALKMRKKNALKEKKCAKMDENVQNRSWVPKTPKNRKFQNWVILICAESGQNSNLKFFFEIFNLTNFEHVSGSLFFFQK